MRARILRINPRGFSFAEPSDGSRALFLHLSALPRGQFESLTVGRAIEITEITMVAKKGPRAVRAHLVEPING